MALPYERGRKFGSESPTKCLLWSRLLFTKVGELFRGSQQKEYCKAPSQVVLTVVDRQALDSSLPLSLPPSLLCAQ